MVTEPTWPGMPEPSTEPHVLVVELDEMDVHEFKIECPGVSDDCRAWLECSENGCTVGVEDDIDNDVEAHGVRHHYVGGAHIGWGTPTDTCWPATSGEIVEAAYAIRTDWIRGRYPICCDLDEHEEHLVLTLPDATA